MTSVDRNIVLITLTIAALVFSSATFVEVGDVSLATLPIIVGLELIVYFIAAMAVNPRATIGMAAGSAVVLMCLRAVCAVVVGGFSVWAMRGDPTAAFYVPWLHPISAVVQVAILLMVGPYLIANFVPELVGRNEAKRLVGDAGQREKGKQIALEASPTGGFIQVFSFEELASVIKKSHGIEGFVIYSSEGLVVWKDIPLRLDVDSLTAKVLHSSAVIGDIMQQSGLTKVRRVMVESREHFLFATTLNQNFGLLLLFNGKVSPDEIISRIAMLAKSSREFLHWKYPALQAAAGQSKDRVAVETY